MQNRIVYDWVSFTTKIHDVSSVIELLGLEDVTFENLNGMNGYRDRLFYDNISICYNGRDDMGVFVNMSGSGCRAFETHGNGDYDMLFREILDNYSEDSEKRQMNLTRLDVAYDDFCGLIDLQEISSDVQKGNFVSRFNEWGLTVGSKGCCVTHGSNTSDTYIRIYDKKAETGRDDVGYWVRCELQLRRNNAIGFISSPDVVDDKYFGVLNNYLRYVIPSDTDTNKRRWETAPHWLAWISSVSPVSIFSKPGTEYDINRLDSFVTEQCSGAISTFIDIVGLDTFLSRIHKVVSTRKLNPKYKHLKESFKNNNNSQGILDYLKARGLAT